MRHTLKNATGKKVGTMVSVKEDVMTDLKTLVNDWLSHELDRKVSDKEARGHAAKTKEFKGKVNKIYSDNEITELLTFDRQVEGKRYSITLGDMEAARAKTDIDHDSIWKDYKNGDISESDMLDMFKGVSKGVIEKTLGESVAVEYFTTGKPVEFNVKVG